MGTDTFSLAFATSFRYHLYMAVSCKRPTSSIPEPLYNMKKSITLIALAFVLLAAGCRQKDYRTAEVRVPNVVNEACEKRVRDALASLKGIELQTLAVDNGVLTVSYDSMQLGLKNIEHAIKDAGFDANEFPADPAARAKLPKECLSPENETK